MDEKELTKKLDCLISTALDVTGKKALKDFEVVSAANLNQNMDFTTRFLAQKTQYEYANEEIYAKLQKYFKGLKTNEETEWLVRELVDARYSLVIREKQTAELKTKGREVIAAHNYGNEILAACTETLKKLLKLNFGLVNLHLSDAAKSASMKETIQLKKKYNKLADTFEESIAKETSMLETRQNT